MSQERAQDERIPASRRSDAERTPGTVHEGRPEGAERRVLGLQREVGNRAVQRLLAQRSGDGPFELDPSTAGRIRGARGGGEPLEGVVQEQMSERMGHDFGGVRVHTSPEADQLNQQLSAKAFTTGQDVFFRQGAYDPGSSQGRELIAHELSHVVQQSTGLVTGSGSGMSVRAANDVFEQRADDAARRALGPQAPQSDKVQTSALQQQEEEEELQTAALQRQEEEEIQTSALQQQEEEEELQTAALQRQEEEELQTSALQRQEEEEDLQTAAIQRQEEEEELQTAAIQRQEEEEELQTSALQRQEEEEEVQMTASSRSPRRSAFAS